MTFDEYKTLQAQVDAVAAQDVHLGRFLDALLLHVAHGAGLDPEQEQAKLDKQAEAQATQEEEAAAPAAEPVQITTEEGV